MDLVENFFATSAGLPLGLYNNAILVARRPSMLAMSKSAGKAHLTLCAVQYCLGPNTTITPAAASIDTMMRSSNLDIRRRGYLARAFAMVAINHFGARQGINLSDVMSLKIGRWISRTAGTMVLEGIWGEGYIRRNYDARNVTGVYLDIFLAFDMLLTNNIWRNKITWENHDHVRINRSSEDMRVYYNPRYCNLAGFGV